MTLQDYTLRAAEDCGETFRDGPADVTALAYFFRDESSFDAKFAALASFWWTFRLLLCLYYGKNGKERKERNEPAYPSRHAESVADYTVSRPLALLGFKSAFSGVGRET